MTAKKLVLKESVFGKGTGLKKGEVGGEENGKERINGGDGKYWSLKRGHWSLYRGFNVK